MTELEIAAQLSVLTGLDQVSTFLNMQKILGQANPGKVLEEYQRSISGLVKVVKVSTSLSLNEQQRQQLVQKLKAKFSKEELVFAYVVETSVAYGIEIRIGDDLIEFSFS